MAENTKNPETCSTTPIVQTPPPTYKKTSWPEVVGMKAEDAEKKIKEDMPEAMVVVVPPDTVALTLDYSFSRVRLFVDSCQIVIKEPRIG